MYLSISSRSGALTLYSSFIPVSCCSHLWPTKPSIGRNARFSGNTQQDAHEFLCELFNQIEEDILPFLKSDHGEENDNEDSEDGQGGAVLALEEESMSYKRKSDKPSRSGRVGDDF